MGKILLVDDDKGIIDLISKYLIKEGFIHRTPRGREVTDLAYSHLSIERYKPDPSLF